MCAKDYPFPVFGTQGGGLVKEVAPNKYVFVEAPPNGMGLDVGDRMPEQWGVIPANEAARELLREEDREDDFELW